MAALIDTNVLVYRFDSRFPEKQRISSDLLRQGLVSSSLILPHQAILEFTSAVTRKQKDGFQILSSSEAVKAAEEFLVEFEVAYPTEAILRTALQGAITHQMGWWDAHLLAYAECLGATELYSEDFQHNRSYGQVRVVNPFLQV